MFRQIIITAISIFTFAFAVRAESGQKYFATNGSATVTERAEVLRLTMTVITQGETAEKAYQRATRLAEDLVSAFRRFGFGPDDYETRYVVERRPHPHEKKKLAFLAGIGLSLVVDDFSAGTQMLDVATQFGVRDFVTYFDVTDRRSAYERALRRALADARIKAEALASETGVKLGSLVQFEELSMPPDDYVYPQPLLPPTFEETDGGQIPPAGAGSVRMAPQSYEIKAEVRAAYAIVE